MGLVKASSQELWDLQRRMDRLFDTGESPLWSPAVDITETADEILLAAELPGMKKEDIDISLSGETLTLSGHRKFEQAQHSEQYLRIERQYGSWRRSFQLEVAIDAAGVTASYEDGVLTVHLPKAKTAVPRQIEIDVK
ncbi:MAG: Hsp20/alpha crystallin family protein [Abditibacteriaceae bacterium]